MTISEYPLILGLSPDQTDYAGKSLYDYCHEKKVMRIGKFIVDSGLMSANYLNR